MATSPKAADHATEVRPVNAGGAVEEKVIEVRGLDGALTRIVERPDGTIEIHAQAMARSGHAVCVPPTGPAHTIGGEFAN